MSRTGTKINCANLYPLPFRNKIVAAHVVFPFVSVSALTEIALARYPRALTEGREIENKIFAPQFERFCIVGS